MLLAHNGHPVDPQEHSSRRVRGWRTGQRGDEIEKTESERVDFHNLSGTIRPETSTGSPYVHAYASPPRRKAWIAHALGARPIQTVAAAELTGHVGRHAPLASITCFQNSAPLDGAQGERDSFLRSPPCPLHRPLLSLCLPSSVVNPIFRFPLASFLLRYRSRGN